MKEIVRGISTKMVFAFFALSTLLAHHAHAQGKQALQQDGSSAPTQCRDNQLTLLRHWGVVVFMGVTRSVDFIFTNISSSPCTLQGYPHFQFLNKYGRPVPGGLAANGVTFQSLYEMPQQLGTMVTIEPGKKAKFVINYHARYDEDREKPCPSYRRAKITVPGMKRVFFQRFRSHGIEVCSGLEVSPVFAASKYD